jgi:hypothetical protein
MDLIGAEPERLTIRQSRALAGKWIAMEMYDRDAQPARRIVAVGSDPAECIRQIAANGLDPAKFEFRLFR